jgi:hypothetical protein
VEVEACAEVELELVSPPSASGERRDDDRETERSRSA